LDIYPTTRIFSIGIGAGSFEGTASRAAGNYSIAIGGGNGDPFKPGGSSTTVNLNGARATGFISMAIGTASVASGGGSSAFGLGSRATAADSAAYGEFSTARGNNSIAMGLFSETRGTASLALGTEATALAVNSVAVGPNGVARGIASMALGAGATATMPRSVAIGFGSVANVADTVSVGSAGRKRRVVNVASGTQPTDAVNLAQLQAATATRAVSAPMSEDADLRHEVRALRTLVNRLEAALTQQQKELAELKLRKVAAGRADQ
jgi:autotransporter adhesin